MNLMLLSPKEIEILKYCEPHGELMWAASIMAIILRCDFRDAPAMATLLLKHGATKCE